MNTAHTGFKIHQTYLIEKDGPICKQDISCFLLWCSLQVSLLNCVKRCFLFIIQNNYAAFGTEELADSTVCSVLYSSVRKYTRRWRSSVPSCSKERAKYPSVPACAGKDVCAQRQLCLELNCFPCFLALQEQQCILKRSLQLEPRLIYTESQ